MDNLNIIEVLSKTSAFKDSVTSELVSNLKKNINLKFVNNDHLQIREKLSGREIFVDAQSDFTFIDKL